MIQDEKNEKQAEYMKQLHLDAEAKRRELSEA